MLNLFKKNNEVIQFNVSFKEILHFLPRIINILPKYLYIIITNQNRALPCALRIYVPNNLF